MTISATIEQTANAESGLSNMVGRRCTAPAALSTAEQDVLDDQAGEARRGRWRRNGVMPSGPDPRRATGGPGAREVVSQSRALLGRPVIVISPRSCSRIVAAASLNACRGSLPVKISE